MGNLNLCKISKNQLRRSIRMGDAQKKDCFSRIFSLNSGAKVVGIWHVRLIGIFDIFFFYFFFIFMCRVQGTKPRGTNLT